MFLEKPLLIWLLSLRFCKLEGEKGRYRSRASRIGFASSPTHP
jgi:hypothetical protein